MFDKETILPTAAMFQEQSTNIRDLAFEFLRERILKGKYEPGVRLIEEELAAEMGISRTPVREAIRKLELEGLVEYLPRRGVIVRELSMQEADEIYGIRGVLEGYAAFLAADNASPEQIDYMNNLVRAGRQSVIEEDWDGEENYHDQLHSLLYSASHNRRLETLLNNFRQYLSMCRRISLRNPGRVFTTWDEHERIVRAIEMHDGELAEHRAREHVEQGRQSFMLQYKPDNL